jgi:uncharacterized NAD(P)/FAD-binding protein YdhS
MRIGIAGVGVAGAALLTHLAAAAEPTWAGRELWLFDELPRLGKGLAFGERMDIARINTRPDRLDLRSTAQPTFSEWSQALWQTVFDLDRDPIPRHVFGDYLTQSFAGAVNTLRRHGVRVHVVPERVEGVEQAGDDSLRVRTAGFATELDRVVLALGPWSRPAMTGLAGGMYPLTETVRRSATQTTIGVLGMGLSAIDGVLALAEHCPDTRIVMASRSGALPWVQATPPTGDATGPRHLTVDAVTALHRRGQLRAETLIGLVRDELAEHGQDLSDVVSGQGWAAHWRDPLANPDDLRAHQALTRTNAAMNHAWALLPAAERPRIRATLGADWMRYRVRMPLRTWRQLSELMSAGRVVRAAGLTGVRADGHGFTLLTTGAPVSVDSLINATGQGEDLRTAGEPLAGLARAGAIGVDADGRGLVEPRTCRAVRADGTVQPALLVLGAATAGTFFVTSALDVIVEQAVRASAYLAQEMSRIAVPT